MDGNKRWSKNNKVSLREGYLKGLKKINSVIKLCLSKKIKYLTVYALSSENVKRPTVGTIFDILTKEYKKVLREFDVKNSVKINIIGQKNNLPNSILKIVNEIENFETKKFKLNLNIAFNYGTDDELVSMVKKIIRNKEIPIEDINKAFIYENLYLSKVPDPDLLIRTGGYKRLSNFILLKLRYTELFFTNTLWPDLSENELSNIFNEFKKIKRNYGL